MKKRIAIISFLILFIAGSVNAKQLWEYGTFEQRAEKAHELGLVARVQDYMGDLGINLKLLEAYEKNESLGGSSDPMQPSGINVNIRQDLVSGASRSDTTLVVDPIKTLDGHYVEFADFNSTKVYAKIDQGNNNEEIFYFTGMTTSTATYTLTGAVWGCNFYNTTCDVDANKKRHFSGAELIFSTDFHFINENFMSLGSDQSITGTKTFGVFPEIATSTSLPDANGEFATKYYVDTVGAGGFTSLNASTTNGLEVYGTSPETVGINASTTKALGFDDDGSLYVKASSTANMAFDEEGELYFNGDDGGTYSGDFSFTGSTTMEDLEINDTLSIGSEGLPYEPITINLTAGDDFSSYPLAVYIEDGDYTVAIQEESTTVDSNAIKVYGANWEGQTFSTGDDLNYITRVDWYSSGDTGDCGTVTFSIYAINSGVPTGSALISSTTDEDNISSGFNSFVFDSALSVSLETTYAFVVSCSAGDASNHVINSNSNNAYSSGTRVYSSDSGSSWTADASKDSAFKVYGYRIDTVGSVYKTKADNSNRLAFVGFNVSTASSGEDMYIQLTGNVDGFSDIEPGEIYYLSDTEGEIATTTGSNSVIVGRGLNENSILPYFQSTY